MFNYAVLTVNKVLVVLRIGICLVLHVKFQGNFVPDNTCSISDCLFSRIHSHFFYVKVLF